MSLKRIDKNWKSNGKEIRYLNKDFISWRQNLIEFAKTYYPTAYNDFNESSPGMMFIEMASYVGDVLSYYLDDTLKESLLFYAKEKQNVIDLAQFLGYKPKIISPAVTKLDVFQLVPSIGSGGSNVPDYRFAFTVRSGMEVNSQTSTTTVFRTTSTVDFGFSSSYDSTEVSVYERDGTTGDPTFYLLKKQVDAVAGRLKETTFAFGDAEKFSYVHLNDEDVIDIVDVRDSDNQLWYLVPYLAQDTIYVEVGNTTRNNSLLGQYRDSVPYLIKLISTPRRFTTKLRPDNTFELHFGAGVSDSPDEIIIPNPRNVGLGLPDNPSTLSKSFDPANFLLTKTYGQAPSNTTLTVKYIVGGGIESNVVQGDLVTVSRVEFDEDDGNLSAAELNLLDSLKDGIAVTNPIPATGGRSGESVEEIRQNALANFSSQNRAVTREDYIVRVLSMPAKYGSVAKVYVAPDGELDVINSSNLDSNKVGTFEKNNPFAINMYVLGYDGNENLTILNKAVKENLKTYIDQHRMLTDGINILDGFIVNIGIDFEITAYPNYNKKEVVLNCINAIKDMFDINDWQFNQPIIINDIELQIANVDGVRSVPNVTLLNNCGGKYSQYSYNINSATVDKIVYPSMDPSVFEIKFKNSDIRGRAL